MVPDKPQKVENFHFTWCGYIGFRTRWYVNKSVKVSTLDKSKIYYTLSFPMYFFVILIQKNRSFSKYSRTSLLISLQLSRLWSSTWSKIRSAKWGNLLQIVSIVQSEIFGFRIRSEQKSKNENSKLFWKLVFVISWLNLLPKEVSIR